MIIEINNKRFKTESFTLDARLAFANLMKSYNITLILYHFDLKYHIQIESNASFHAINENLSQLTLDDSGWLHLIVFFFRKIILTETQYKTHNDSFFAIIWELTTLHHYLGNYKYEILDFINHNNLEHFINRKSVWFKEVCLAQKLSKYYFQINYCHCKAHRATDTLLHYC